MLASVHHTGIQVAVATGEVEAGCSEKAAIPLARVARAATAQVAGAAHLPEFMTGPRGPSSQKLGLRPAFSDSSRSKE